MKMIFNALSFVFSMAFLASIIALIYFVVKKDKEKRKYSAIIAIVSFFVVAFVPAPHLEEKKKEEEKQEQVEKEQKEKEDKKEEKKKEEKKEPESPYEKIEQAAKNAYGDDLEKFEMMDHRDGEEGHYKVYVYTSVGLTKKNFVFGSNDYTTDFLKEIQDQPFKTVFIEYQTDFTDKFGNETQDQALFFEFTKETVDKINFDNFDLNKLPDVADHYWRHGTFD